MAVYLDSANLDEAYKAKAMGWVHGVTTNPSLMAKAGAAPETVLSGLAELAFPEIYYQLVSHNLDEMMNEARIAAGIIKSGLVLKVVPTENGFRFVARHGNEFPCCITAVFDPSQALIAREAGAGFIAVYVESCCQTDG